jgi:hypothetical protein
MWFVRCSTLAPMRQIGRVEGGSDCLAGQAEICCHERLSRNIALRIVMSLRATAEIFRTIKMRPIMDIPPHKVPQCLSGRHRLDRRALYGSRILNKTIPFFTRSHPMPFSGRRSGCAWLFPRRTTRSRQRPYRILGRVRDGRTHPNKRQGDWACSTWEPSSGPNEECDRSRGR